MIAGFIETVGEGVTLALGGAVVGIAFGFFAQRSRFCLRAAVIEFWHRRFGEKLSVWLLAFSSAVVAVQLLALAGFLDTSAARQIASRGSLWRADRWCLVWNGDDSDPRLCKPPVSAVG